MTAQEPIRLKSSDLAFWPAYLSEASATAIWVKLHEKATPPKHDPFDPSASLSVVPADLLEPGERKLYDALSAKFTLDASLGLATAVEKPSGPTFEDGGALE